MTDLAAVGPDGVGVVDHQGEDRDDVVHHRHESGREASHVRHDRVDRVAWGGKGRLHNGMVLLGRTEVSVISSEETGLASVGEQDENSMAYP